MNEQEISIFENSVSFLCLKLSESDHKNITNLSLTVTCIVDQIQSEEKITNNHLDYLDTKIPHLAKNIQNISEKYESQLRERKERFNVFDCLTKHHLEELHTKFISYLLDVKGKHDYADVFLNVFIEVLKDENPNINEALSGLKLDLLQSKIKQQKHIGRKNDNPDIYGFIDIFIQIPIQGSQSQVLNIAIENKVLAVEQEDQIKRYVLYCEDRLLKNGEPYLGLYLTLDGKESNEAGGQIYHCISYKKTILLWLERIHKAIHAPLVQNGIFFYQRLLESKILYLPSIPIIMEIKEILLKEENLLFLKYGDEIIKTIEEIGNQFRKNFFEKVAIELGEKYGIIPIETRIKTISKSEIWTKGSRGLMIDNDEYTLFLNETDKIVLLIEQNFTDIYYGLYGIKTDNGKNIGTFDCGTFPVANKIEEIFRHKLQYSYEQQDDWWFMWKFYKPLKKDISFSSNSLNYDFAINLDEIVSEFVLEIGQYLRLWKETIGELPQLTVLE